MKRAVLSVLLPIFSVLVAPRAGAWISYLDGAALPQANGWTVDASDTGTIVDLGSGNSGIRQTDNSDVRYAQWSLPNTNAASTLAARFSVDAYAGGPLNILQLSTANSATNPSPTLAIGIREGRFYLLRVLADDAAAPPEEARLADLGPVQEGIFSDTYLHIDNTTKRVRLFWNGGLRYTGIETNAAHLLAGPAAAEFGASNRFPQQDRSGAGIVTFDWVGFGTAADLPLALPFIAWSEYLDGSTIPAPPWQIFLDPAETGTSSVIEFADPANGATNQAIRITSAAGANEYYVGPFQEDETFAAARFVVREFSATGKENLFCVTTRSLPVAPCPAITLVDGRYKLWNYVESDTELFDIGPAVSNEFHTVYLYAHYEGRVKLWWDGTLIFDAIAPRTNPYDGYFEWGSGSWQFDASDMIDFDWVAFGAQTSPPQLTTTPAHGAVFQDAAAGFSFTIASDAGVATNAITLLVNGVDRTANLNITGTDTARQGSLSGLASNQLYRIAVIYTTALGNTSSNIVVFDTFSQGNFTIEAEDWNFESGQFIDNPAPTAQTAGNSYFGRIGFEDIDHNELSTDFGASQHDYRDFVFVGTEPAADVLRQKYIDAQAIDPAVRDFNVGWVEPTEWLNYTRTFPTGTFNIYGRFANGNVDQTFEAALDKVADATTATQTTTAVGVFRGGLGRGWQDYDFVPLTDAAGNLLAVSLAGVETLRVTAVSGGYNANFYMLVPSSPAAPRLNIGRDAGNLVITWAGAGFTLQTAADLRGPWSPVNAPGNLYTVTPGASPQFFRLTGN